MDLNNKLILFFLIVQVIAILVFFDLGAHREFINWTLEQTIVRPF